MHTNNSNTTYDVTVDRENISSQDIDFGDRDLLIAFNEPAFKRSDKSLQEGDLDAKLNARLPSYFLPMVEVSRRLQRRPRMFVVSGLNMALKWNAENDHQRKVMMIDNNLKIDFLRRFFERFFPDDFSVIEYIVAQDPVKINESKLLGLWQVLERRYPEQIADLRYALAKYKRPRLFGGEKLSEEAKEFLGSQDQELINAFKYAISHLFVMADINFEGNYIHNPVGYVTVGGPNEKVFNKLRSLAYSVIQDVAEIVFERDVIFEDNLRLVIETESKAPVPYNGSFRSRGDKTFYDEVTFENGESLVFYGEHEKLKPDLDYIYSFISREEYESFWNEYRERYFDLKERYKEAYQVTGDF